MLVTHAGRTGSTADVAKITNEVHLTHDYRRPETSEGKTIRGEFFIEYRKAYNNVRKS